MGTVTFLAPASPQWLLLELNLMNVLRRLLGNESPFGWCDFVTSIEPSGPCAEFCDHFGPVVRLTRVGRRYEVTCLPTDAPKRTANLGRAATLIRARWKAGFMPTRMAQRAIKSVEALAPHSIFFNNESRFGYRPTLGFSCTANNRVGPKSNVVPPAVELQLMSAKGH
jgi:hypothetical protein